MKVRWRAHEMVGVGIVVAWQVVILLTATSGHTIAELEADFVGPFRENGVPFAYWRNVLVPKVSSLLSVFAVYLLVNLLVLPSFKKIRGEDIERLFSVRIVKAILSLLLVAFLLALGINIISFYGRPHFFNYRDYQWLAIAGYNDKPLTDIFFGFGRVLSFVAVATALAGIRDLVIWLIERNGSKREYRVMIVNNATPLLVIYFCLLFIINPLYPDFLRYLVFVSPLVVLYMYLTFWLFPFMDQKTLQHRSVYTRLLLSTFICILPSFLVFAGHGKPFIPLLYWMLLLGMATPLFWIIYQQRKEKILQLKNMETALAKSDANLQFLKAQINPHFLFNALNTLYGTALKGESENTAMGIQKLGEMMRFLLHENTLDQIPIEKEIEYLNNFIELQKLRIQSSPDISIEESIEYPPIAGKIAPMLLIPFVENAFKHGVSLIGKSWIMIKLECRDNILNFEVRNSIHKNGNHLEQGKSGIGLANVKERLRLQYPGKHRLDIAETDKEFTVKLTLPC